MDNRRAETKYEQLGSVAWNLSFGARRFLLCTFLVVEFCLLLNLASAQAPLPVHLELARPAHTWEFLDAVGMRAGLFGTQDGKFEAWVYPLKLFRDFHLMFTADGREFPAESLARSITARPESVTVTYSGDNFTVNETWFVPYDAAGAVIQLDIETWTPLQIQARFLPDMQMMWPALLSSVKEEWDPPLHAFTFSEETGRYYGLIGSADGANATVEQASGSTGSPESILQIPTVPKGRATKLIVIAGSVTGRKGAEATYQKLLSSVAALREASAAHYDDFLARTTSIEVPDSEIQQAYDWARLSMVQGMVNDPLLGTGLVAGYRISGTSARPGFAWFFGRDSEWTSLAMDSIGDFSDVRTALEFLTRFQRDDGKVEHEIAQSASLVPWFTGNSPAYGSADATPLFLIAMDQYVRASGDTQFLETHWDNISRAYKFLRSTWDEQHHPTNLGVGHGWVEGGPLLPVKTELYQSGLGVEALRSLGEMAHLARREDPTEELDIEAEHQRTSLDHDFWSDRLKAYAYALDQQNGRLETPSVLTTVPMWFGLLDAAHSQSTIDVLAGPDHMSGWGMRILSADDPRYDPSGYHFGSVWPLFTGWASVGEYRYHRALPAYANLRANALLTLAGAPGRTTEVLSGEYFDSLLASSPHQIWSSAMVISPVLRGMMGLEADAQAHTLRFTPHVPAGWDHFKLRNIWVGKDRCNFAFQRTANEISLDMDIDGGELDLRFAPAIALRARVLSVRVDGRPAKYHLAADSQDQHVELEIRANRHTTVRIRLQHDFDIEEPASLPAPGQKSRGTRVISQAWTPKHDQWKLQMSGIEGASYDFTVRGADQIASVDGASLIPDASGGKFMRVQFPDTAQTEYINKTVVIHFRQ
jgi:glycogen debranching enzyme